MKLKVSRCRYATLGLKGLTLFDVLAFLEDAVHMELLPRDSSLGPTQEESEHILVLLTVGGEVGPCKPKAACGIILLVAQDSKKLTRGSGCTASMLLNILVTHC